MEVGLETAPFLQGGETRRGAGSRGAAGAAGGGRRSDVLRVDVAVQLRGAANRGPVAFPRPGLRAPSRD